ncbi:hypothetical protein PAESOLCIP111_01961 [Paenibacillus solanacearum]|uniref:RNA polymerase sigma-70 ECF-like HTH domain-containing protein n=1 Tax=Paenibacillus solanacearum TaxID=2048548 RepID=A0A916K181_9BACL|nr:ECF-type sigma factor [Paenibacillus solanacearum]CAG7616939.1 hypothetical protein PAESOLCIP111_01961 [Paenibacillus solanacearum]
MPDNQAIQQLKSYKQITLRMKVLEKYPIGNGMYLSQFQEDDNLQTLHRQLKHLPSYMYLSKHEQKLETVAHTYLTHYPTGTKAQLNAIPTVGHDAEDEKLLRELRSKIQKVIEARAGRLNDFDAMIERVSELQELEQQKQYIEHTLEVLAEYKPQYAQLLKLQFIEGKSIDEVADALNIVRRTYDRWKPKAFEEYGKIFSAS